MEKNSSLQPHRSIIFISIMIMLMIFSVNLVSATLTIGNVGGIIMFVRMGSKENELYGGYNG